MYPIDEACGTLRQEIDGAVDLGDPAKITELVKHALQDALKTNRLALPERYRAARPDTYARRLLHRDPDGRYTAVVMTWGPDQKTALHDHAGIWCVECVVDGDMEVAQYDLVGEAGDTCRFIERSRVHAGRGSAGCLIPPFEYHTLANIATKPSITLHVYGGEMDHCHVFEPAPDGSYRRMTRQLAYHE